MEENEKLQQQPPQRRRQRWRNFTETTNNENNKVFDSTSTPKVPTQSCKNIIKF